MVKGFTQFYYRIFRNHFFQQLLPLLQWQLGQIKMVQPENNIKNIIKKFSIPFSLRQFCKAPKFGNPVFSGHNNFPVQNGIRFRTRQVHGQQDKTFHRVIYYFWDLICTFSRYAVKTQDNGIHPIFYFIKPAFLIKRFIHQRGLTSV